MKLFAMIDGQQHGPMELDEIVAAGVRPDTYVWAKGMPDWQKASEVPDICRYFRLRLAGVLPASPGRNRQNGTGTMLDEQEEQERLLAQLPPMARNIVRKSGVKLRKEDMPQPSDHQDLKWLPIIIYTACTILIIIGFLLLQL